MNESKSVLPDSAEFHPDFLNEYRAKNRVGQANDVLFTRDENATSPSFRSYDSDQVHSPTSDLVITTDPQEAKQAILKDSVSVLFARRTSPSSNFSTAIIATDHSPYATTAINRFIALKLGGIKRVRVLCSLAQSVDHRESSDIGLFTNGMGPYSIRTIQELNRSLLESLALSGFEADARVTASPLEDFVLHTQDRMNPDLLVLALEQRIFEDERESIIDNLMTKSKSSVIVLKP